MKKKVISLMLTALMAGTALAGCGGGGNAANSASGSSAATSDSGSTADSQSASDTSSAGETFTIGVCQQLEHVALDQATQGFVDACNELFGEGKVTIDVKNGQNEQNNCATIANDFVAQDVDLIMANGTTALQCSAAATNSIPILGTSITDYGTALDISDWTGTTGTNISGTSDLAPIDEQADMLVELLPDVKKVGILYCSAEPNSEYQANMFAEAMEEKNVEYAAYTAADSNEIQSVVTNAIAECDVLYIPTDNTMASSTEIINNICEPAGVPIIAGEQGICSGCGIATLSISYYDLGYKTGEMVYDILVNGADVTSMAVESAPNVTKMYNPSLCESLNITIPEGYEAIEG